MNDKPPPPPGSSAVEQGHWIAQRYVLRRPIASGGMAQVWEAEDTVLGRSVAVKILHPHLAEDREVIQRFRAEAKAAARLSHPSIVAIFDTATEGHVEAIVMELIDGLTLRAYLDEHGALSAENAIDLATQVADALEAAHAAGIVHRDIKPANIILCPDRRTKVTDFGIAKAIESTDLTTTGAVLGTAKYLAPEQVEGGEIDARTDIYSLGVVLFEALTARAPFEEATDAATALARLRVDAPSPRTHDPSVPAALEKVTLTAMDRDPARRYPSASAMREALTATTDGPEHPLSQSVSVRPARTATVATGPDATAIEPRPATESPAHNTGATKAPAADHQRRLEPMLVLLLVAGCLALGIGLILTTGKGRELFDRLGDRFSEEPAPEETEPAGSAAVTAPSVTSQPSTESQQAIPTPLPVTISPTELDVTEILDFDPLGDGDERPDLLTFASDGDPTTMWASEGYNNRSFGNLKSGLGLIVVLDRESTLSELLVASPTEGWAASVYTAQVAGETLEAWGDRIDALVNIEGDAIFDLRGVRAKTVLLWVTDLGNGPAQTRIEVAELTLS